MSMSSRGRAIQVEPGVGLVWRGADRFVRRCHDAALHRLFAPRWVAVQVAFALVGSCLVAVTIARRRPQFHAAPAHIPLILGLGLVAVAIHELGHALATVHYERHVRHVGLRLHLGLPAFFVDSLDALLLSRRQRLIQAAAGPFAEWNMTALAALAIIAMPPDGPATAVLHRFVVVNAIGIAVNLLPFAGLDGSLLLADAIREPDLAFTSRQAMSRRRPATRRDRWLIGYAVANAIVAGLLVLSAAFFWWQLFGGLTGYLLNSGAVGVAGLVVLIGLVTAPLRRTGWDVLHALGRHVRRLSSRIVFRLQRRWRVEAITAFRILPDISPLDASALGIVAGQLQRVDARTAAPPATVASHCFVGGRARRGWLGPLRPATSGAVLEIEHYRAARCTSQPGAVVLLPTRWRELLVAGGSSGRPRVNPNTRQPSGITVDPLQGG